LVGLIEVRTSDAEIFAARERSADIDVQRPRKEALASGALENFGVAGHACAKVLHAVRNATGDLHDVIVVVGRLTRRS